MKPCDECKLRPNCDVNQFIVRHGSEHPWALDSIIRQYTMGVALVSAAKGNIVLECSRFEPLKPQESYETLLNARNTCDDDCDCSNKSSCGKKCCK